MTHRLTELLDHDAIVGEDRFQIRALFHDQSSRKIRKAAIDVGGWLDRREILVDIDRFGQPDGKDWPVSITREELEDATEWTDREESSASLPPLVVGPFGYTFSPMLMVAGMASSAERSLPEDPDEGSRDLVSRSGGNLGGMERCSDWLGRDAFGPEGHLGKVTDLMIDDWTISGIATENGTEMPLARLRHIAEQGHFVFD